MTDESATPYDPREKASKVVAVVDGQKRIVGQSYNRGKNATFGPSESQLTRPTGLQRHLVTGLMPDDQFIDAETTIVAFGSCFANNISTYLNNLGYNVSTKKDNVAYISRMGDGMVNTYAIRQQFEWAWNNVVPKEDLWSGYNAEKFGYDEGVRLRTAELFDAADVFIITLGLSEIWYDEPTGEVFWRAVPKDKYDPERHKFRIANFGESLENLRAIYGLIRAKRPDATIVFTVSPVALAATFRPISCVVANTESKAILRAAIGEMMREKQPSDPKLFYFPSYEIVTEAFHHPFGNDRRHVQPHVLELNMKTFERYFCKTDISDKDLENAYAGALLIDKELGGNDQAAVKARINDQKNADREKYNADLKARGSNKINSLGAQRQAARDKAAAARGKTPDLSKNEKLAAAKAARTAEAKALRASKKEADAETANARKLAKRAERKEARASAAATNGKAA